MSKIHFANLYLSETVHVMGGLGFTRYLMLYVWAKDHSEVERVLRAYCIGKGIGFERCDSREAKQQALYRYTSPEQIYGVPVDLATAAIHAKDLGETITAGSVQDLHRNAALIESGMKALDALQEAGRVAA